MYFLGRFIRAKKSLLDVCWDMRDQGRAITMWFSDFFDQNYSIYFCWALATNLSLQQLVLTWLILPVVICLFQRLSHASLSISFYTAKLRIAHYNSCNPHDDYYYMDIHGNSGANTCKNTWLFGRVAVISFQTQSPQGVIGDHND